ncbi:MAG: hypothetical protein AB7F40_04575 [Victivallaceae bacterium]
MSFDVMKIVDSMQKPTSEKPSSAAIKEIEVFFDGCGYRRDIPELFDLLCRLGASEVEHTSKRGLFLRGDPGIGKTLGVKLLAASFGWVMLHVSEIVGFYKRHPCYEEWEGYCRALELGVTPRTMVIDDLGVEDFPMNDYGTPCNPLSELLDIRYRRSFSRDGVRTVITSNITDSEIKRRYGFRISDRLNEMCPFATVKGDSLRR